jgi:hypothetical protein
MTTEQEQADSQEQEHTEAASPKQDEEKLRTIRHKIKADSDVVTRLVDQLVNEYSREIDRLVSEVKDMLVKKDTLDDEEIEKCVLRFPVYMYSAVNGVENVGIQAELAKANKMEVLNQAFEAIEGTIPDKTKYAELESFNEHLMTVVFEKAYRKLKAKIEHADKVYSATKKVMEKRIAEMGVLRRDRNG